MVVLQLLDAIAVHALAAAQAAYVTGPKAYDVKVGFRASKGRCVRIYYGGERDAAYFGEYSLTSTLIGQSIHVTGYWPTPSTASTDQRLIEGEMATFVKEMRTRIHGDSDIGTKAVDLIFLPASVDQLVLPDGTQTAVVDIEIGVDFDEYTRTR